MCSMYYYDGLINLLKKSEFTSKLRISFRTIAKIGKGEKLADNVIVHLYNFFDCKKEDIY